MSNFVGVEPDAAYVMGRTAGRNEAFDEILEVIFDDWKDCEYRYGEEKEIRIAMKTAKRIHERISKLKDGRSCTE